MVAEDRRPRTPIKEARFFKYGKPAMEYLHDQLALDWAALPWFLSVAWLMALVAWLDWAADMMEVFG